MTQTISPSPRSLEFKQYRFQPGWYQTAVLIICLPLFVCLGFWQLDRAEQKRAVLTAFVHNQQAAPIALLSIIKDKQLEPYQHVTVKGRYDRRHSWLIDNKFNEHHLGYHVVTPFVVKGSKQVLLVNRGWLQAPRSRQVLPKFKTRTAPIQLTGRIEYPSTKGVMLGSIAEQTSHWPMRIQKVDVDFISKHLHKKVYPFVLLLDAKAKTGFVRNWQPVVMKPARHQAYALQWFTFALITLIIFIAMSLTKTRKDESNNV